MKRKVAAKCVIRVEDGVKIEVKVKVEEKKERAEESNRGLNLN